MASAQKIKPFLDSLKHKEFNILPLPSITVGPEIGIMYGFFVDYYYKLSKKDDTLTRPSVSFVSLQYSTKKQMNAELYTSAFTRKEKYYVLFKAGYYDDFEQYWGKTSPSLGNDDYIMARYKRYLLSGRIAKNIGQKHFLGLGYQYNTYYDVAFSKIALKEFVPAMPASSILGLGLVYNIDKRDNQFSPTKGYYADFTAYKMFDMSKKTSGYTQYNLDLRKYHEIKKHVVANQFVLGSQQGEVPIFEKQRIGGPMLMRGLFKGRFRDDNLWAIQSEYRYEVIPLVKLAAFASVGNTAPTFSSLFQQQIIVGYGAGLRLRVNKTKKIYAKIDYAPGNSHLKI